MTDNDIPQLLLETLNAYVGNFGRFESTQEVQAVTDLTMTLLQKQGKLALDAGTKDRLIQQVMGQFDLSQTAASWVEPARVTLATQVHEWQTSLENQVMSTLDAYAQNYLPLQGAPDLREAVLSILPMIETSQMGRAAVDSLVKQVSAKFSWQDALAKAVTPDAAAIAQKLVLLLQHGNLEGLLQETVTAYLTNFTPDLTATTESLVETALSTVLGSGVEFDFDMKMSPEDQNLLIKQVSFKLNLIQPSAAPSKTAQEIATRMNLSIETFRRERAKRLESRDLTRPTIFGDLEVGIPIHPATPRE